MVSDLPPAAGETIGQRLRRLRLERGLSQRELAAPGVSYAYISRIEAGTRQPSVKALRKLAAKLGVGPDYLETGSELGSEEHLELKLADLELAVRLGEGGESAPELEALAAEALRAGDRESALRAQVSLAALAQATGDHQRAAKLLEGTLAGEDAPSPADRHDIYTELGRAYAASGRPERAVALFERCLEALEEAGIDDPTLEARYATLLSYALSDSGNLERAEQVVQDALERTEGTEDSYTRIRLYWSLARVALAEGREPAALQNARKAIALLEATEDTVNLARAHLLAATIRIARSSAAEAAGHLDHAERLFGRSATFVDRIMLRVKRAQVAALRSDGPTAVRLARGVLDEIGEQLPEEKGAAYCALADGLALQHQHGAANEAYRLGVELLEQRNQWRDAAAGRRAWARMLDQSGRTSEAAQVLEESTSSAPAVAPAES
jgi:transcriptional regulator with XRE-family HTH domain